MWTSTSDCNSSSVKQVCGRSKSVWEVKKCVGIWELKNVCGNSKIKRWNSKRLLGPMLGPLFPNGRIRGILSPVGRRCGTMECDSCCDDAAGNADDADTNDHGHHEGETLSLKTKSKAHCLTEFGQRAEAWNYRWRVAIRSRGPHLTWHAHTNCRPIQYFPIQSDSVR